MKESTGLSGVIGLCLLIAGAATISATGSGGAAVLTREAAGIVGGSKYKSANTGCNIGGCAAHNTMVTDDNGKAMLVNKVVCSRQVGSSCGYQWVQAQSASQE